MLYYFKIPFSDNYSTFLDIYSTGSHGSNSFVICKILFILVIQLNGPIPNSIIR